MIYTEIYKTLTELINNKPDPQKLLTMLNEPEIAHTYPSMEKRIIRKLATISVITGSVTLSDIIRISHITTKHCHVIITEVTDEYVQKAAADNTDSVSFLSVASTLMDDDIYTVIFTEDMSNKDSINFTHVMLMYTIIINEFTNYKMNIENSLINRDDDFVGKVLDYSRMYIPIGICDDCGISFGEFRESERDKSIEEFLSFKDEYKDAWVTDLFDNEVLISAEDVGYENIFCLEEDIMKTRDIDEEELDD